MFDMERNLKIVIEYDGTCYHGWQIQPNGVTIQEKIEEVLERLTRTRPTVVGSGRTDAGVHAEAQVAHFRTLNPMRCEEMQRGLNALLPDDIVVRKVEEVPEDFHARYSARGKTYRYVILNRSYPSAFEHHRSWQLSCHLDMETMNKAASCLLGRHDFSCFQASDCCAKHPNREIRKLDVFKDGDWMAIMISADAFLKHMVRNIVGTLVEVGRGKMSVADVEEILKGRDRTLAGPTAPSKGLFLVSVEYA